MIKIQSQSNKTYQKIKSLHQKKYRHLFKSYLVEGKKMVEEALKLHIVERLIFDEDFICLDEYSHKEKVVLDKKFFKEISSMQNPEGIIAQVQIVEKEIEFAKLYLALDGIKDPGNMGTILRSAEAFSFTNIILLGDCVDLYNEKTLRASMGSIFRLNIKNMTNDEFIDFSKGKTIYSTSLKTDLLLTDIKIQLPAVLTIGSESHGISKFTEEISDYLVKIKMSESIDSLNAAIAASISMYEFSKGLI